MKNTFWMTMILAASAAAQVTIPDGTRVRVRLEQTLTSETAEQGQPGRLDHADREFEHDGGGDRD